MSFRDVDKSLATLFERFISEDRISAAEYGGRVKGMLFALQMLDDALIGWRVLVEERAIYAAREAWHLALSVQRREEALAEFDRRRLAVFEQQQRKLARLE